MQEVFELKPAELTGSTRDTPRAETARKPSRINTVRAILADAAQGPDEYVSAYNVVRGAE